MKYSEEEESSTKTAESEGSSISSYTRRAQESARPKKRSVNDMQKETSPHVLVMNDKPGVFDQDLIDRRVIHGLKDKSTKYVWLEKGQVNLDEAVAYYHQQGYCVYNIVAHNNEVLTTRYDFEVKLGVQLEQLSYEAEVQLGKETQGIDDAMCEMEADIQEGQDLNEIDLEDL